MRCHLPLFTAMDTDIIRSFQYFHEKILPKAFTSPDFCKESFMNAFLWADFCEKLYEKLDAEGMRKLKEYFSDQSNFQTEDNLKLCTTILCHAFLQNPSIDRNTLKTVVSRIKPNDFNLTEVWDDALELDSLCANLVESLKPISLKDSERSLYYEVKCELFVDFLKDMTDQLGTGQSETYLHLLFETLCMSEDTMMVLLNLLVYDDLKNSEIQAFAMHWVLLKLLEDENGQLAQFLWKQPAYKLQEIASTHVPFYSYYLNFLIKNASSMHCAFKNADKEWKTNKSMQEVFLSYEEVVKHLQDLTSRQDNIGKDSHAHLGMLAQREPESAIWRDILSAIT